MISSTNFQSLFCYKDMSLYICKNLNFIVGSLVTTLSHCAIAIKMGKKGCMKHGVENDLRNMIEPLCKIVL